VAAAPSRQGTRWRPGLLCTVLERGGNAVDATVAAQAVCAVVMPQACGLGGDALMLVRTGDGVLGLTGSGRSPAGAPTGPPGDGGASVTVPGAVQAWVDAVHRWGSLPLADCLAPALGLAADGFVVGALLAGAAEAQRARLLAGGAADWPITTAEAGDHVVQPELAALLAAIGDRGRPPSTRGAPQTAVAAAVRRHGGAMTATTSPSTAAWSAHRCRWPGTAGRVRPAAAGAGSAAGHGAAVVGVGRRAGRAVLPQDADHVGVELTEAAFGHRDRCAADGGGLLDVELSVDRSRAARRGGPRAYLHTTGVAVADAEGRVVSSLVSVFDDFGSAVLVPEAGIVLNDRAAGFTGPRTTPARAAARCTRWPLRCWSRAGGARRWQRRARTARSRRCCRC
jgi:gamma-glutamyltranspeptidase/glutathione hydrolase